MTAYVPVPRPVVEALLDTDHELGGIGDDGPIRNDLRAALRRDSVPPWHLTENAIRQLRRLVADRGARGTFELDQLRGAIRDELDKLGVSLRDETAVYHGLVWTGLVVELARNGHNAGHVSPATYKAVQEIATTIASALLEYVPREVLS